MSATSAVSTGAPNSCVGLSDRSRPVVDNNDIMNSVSEKGDLDIANMSDFSDDEDGLPVDSWQRTQTGCVQDSSCRETSSWCDQPVANMVTARGDKDLLDPNDREYWTKFRLLTKQAFLLHDDCLSDLVVFQSR